MPRWPAALLLVCLSGCTELGHARQCRTFAKFINGRLDEIAKVNQSRSDPKSYVEIASGYDALGRDLTHLSISDPKLKAEVPEVANVFSRAAGATRRAARAVELHDNVLFAQAQRELERVDQRHRAIVRKLDGICH